MFKDRSALLAPYCRSGEVAKAMGAAQKHPA